MSDGELRRAAVLAQVGWAVVSIASAHGQSAVAPFEVKRSQDEAAAMAAIGGGG